jgi:membrane dipeptidase
MKGARMNNFELAKKLHQESIVVDAHLDLGGIVYNRRKKGMTRVLEHELYEEMRAGGVNVVVAAIFIETEFVPDMALKLALLQISHLYQDVSESVDKFAIVTSYDEMMQAIEQNQIAIILSLEGADPITNSLDLIDIFYKLGVRGLGITWSRRNYAADGSYFYNPIEGKTGGLTPFGVKLVRRAEVLGMFIDLSHINEDGFSDVLAFTKLSCIASHSNSRELNDITRNISKSQVKQIAERGGVIGVAGYYELIDMNHKIPSVQSYCDHIDYFVKTVGEDYVGFGFDLCSKYYEMGEQLDVIKGHHEMILITEELLNRGYSIESVKKIMGLNFLHYFKNRLK